MLEWVKDILRSWGYLSYPPSPFDKARFFRGIQGVETGGLGDPHLQVNPTSTASGLYQILWSTLADPKVYIPELIDATGIKMTQDEFLRRTDIQHAVMDRLFTKGFRYKHGLVDKYGDRLTVHTPATRYDLVRREFAGEDFDYTEDEIYALQHFLGRGGARRYLRSLLPGGPPYTAPGKNLSPRAYIEKYRYYRDEGRHDAS